MSKKFLGAVGLTLIALVCFVGCKKDNGCRKATGVVTMGGQPVEGAAVTFLSEDGSSDGGSGITDATGAFSISSGILGDGVKPGNYKVTVSKRETVEDPDQAAFDAGEITYDELQERKSKKGTTGRSAAGESLVPIAYSRVNQTPLTAAVTDDEKSNVFNFELEE